MSFKIPLSKILFDVLKADLESIIIMHMNRLNSILQMGLLGFKVRKDGLQIFYSFHIGISPGKFGC